MKKYVLSVNGLKELSRDIDFLQRQLPKSKEIFISNSLDYLEERAKYYIQVTTGGSSWYELTHTLENSFKKDVELGKLINDCWYSAYVEFGTGVVGRGTHDDPKNYAYDANNHGENGWWFYDEEGHIHWTKGMTAHRYMYQALIDYISGEYKVIFMRSLQETMGGLFR